MPMIELVGTSFVIFIEVGFPSGQNVDTFPIKNVLQQGDTVLLLLYRFALEYSIKWVKRNGRD